MLFYLYPGSARLKRISDSFVFLHPPEKLVVEVTATGIYTDIVWTRNAQTHGKLSEFTNFFEIFVREPTTMSDYGEYNIFFSGAGGVGRTIFVVPTSNFYL